MQHGRFVEWDGRRVTLIRHATPLPCNKLGVQTKPRPLGCWFEVEAWLVTISLWRRCGFSCMFACCVAAGSAFECSSRLCSSLLVLVRAGSGGCRGGCRGRVAVPGDGCRIFRAFRAFRAFMTPVNSPGSTPAALAPFEPPPLGFPGRACFLQKHPSLCAWCVVLPYSVCLLACLRSHDGPSLTGFWPLGIPPLCTVQSRCTVTTVLYFPPATVSLPFLTLLFFPPPPRYAPPSPSPYHIPRPEQPSPRLFVSFVFLN